MTEQERAERRAKREAALEKRRQELAVFLADEPPAPPMPEEELTPAQRRLSRRRLAAFMRGPSVREQARARNNLAEFLGTPGRPAIPKSPRSV